MANIKKILDIAEEYNTTPSRMLLFDDGSDEELKKRLPEVKIISRARPNDKERVVRTLKAMDEVVAVTGDGTNDAPALNAAHVGLSMGDGTAVAKEASDMTILDNSFSTIANAVMWGRSLPHASLCWWAHSSEQNHR